MAHQYADNSSKTGFERKYEKALENTKEEFDQKKLQYNTVPRQDKIETPDILEFMQKNRPNKSFTQAYNERAVEEEEAFKREALKEKYDKNGNLLSYFWEDDNFKTIHDPLNIYKKKNNYDDLAWKVFRNVDDEDIFLKTLYYPRISDSDHKALINIYNDYHKQYNFRRRLAYLSIIGASIAGWGFAYARRLKFVGFLGTTLGIFFGSKLLLDRVNFNSLKSNLNNSSTKFAEKYPAIKFSKVKLVKSDTVNIKN